MRLSQVRLIAPHALSSTLVNDFVRADQWDIELDTSISCVRLVEKGGDFTVLIPISRVAVMTPAVEPTMTPEPEATPPVPTLSRSRKGK
jgi:hypothetical protein